MNDREEPIIWTLWWQGIDKAPSLVQACIKSMKKYAENAKVIVLDADNYLSYITIPPVIFQKFEKGIISLTHYSDIIRFQLLEKYGGLWLDSTILVTSPIPKQIFEMDLYTIKYQSMIKKHIYSGRWTSFLIGGRKENRCFRRMNELFELYWVKNDDLVCYLWIDYFMYIISIEDMKIFDDLGEIPIIENNPYYLEGILNNPIEKFDSSKCGLFQKLNWKNQHFVEHCGKKTIYCDILEKYNIFTEKGVNFKRKSVLRKKVMSLICHLEDKFSKKKICCYGLKICLLNFFNVVMRSNNGFVARYVAVKYDEAILAWIGMHVIEEKSR